jgi:hypothetical protein
LFFSKSKNPKDPTVAKVFEACLTKPWHPHWLIYVGVGLICPPLLVAMLLNDLIRKNVAAYHRDQAYTYAARGEQYKVPKDNRIMLWLIAAAIVASICYVNILLG